MDLNFPYHVLIKEYEIQLNFSVVLSSTFPYSNSINNQIVTHVNVFIFVWFCKLICLRVLFYTCQGLSSDRKITFLIRLILHVITK